MIIKFLIHFSILVFFEKNEHLNDKKFEILKKDWQDYYNIF